MSHLDTLHRCVQKLPQEERKFMETFIALFMNGDDERGKKSKTFSLLGIGRTRGDKLWKNAVKYLRSMAEEGNWL